MGVGFTPPFCSHSAIFEDAVLWLNGPHNTRNNAYVKFLKSRLSRDMHIHRLQQQLVDSKGICSRLER